MTFKQVKDLTQTQRDRLAFIELRLHFLGEIRRQDLTTRFGIQAAAATRDIGFYKELAPDNLDYNTKNKIYTVGEGFKPVFDFPPERVLTWLSQGYGDGEPARFSPWIACEIPSRLAHCDLEILASVTRAIHNECPLKIVYHSISSGKTEREIIPFALIDNGLRWHVRAFDRNTQNFRDFVISRIRQPIVMREDKVDPCECQNEDIQWSRIVELDLVPHPNQPRPEITEMDYGMIDGELKLKMRGTIAGYVLRKWCVDCSPDHSLHGPEHRLWLKDHLALYGVESAAIAPGYASPTERK
ncbi:WYL domain-containing protein [Methylomicrobium agile]|uniref:WYL domain-containing protein n=1 Tax=Methylomicrobium agile TaxID=39774 RepID=UPI0004DF1853|nr:WYL domain-containing protein [Methylomicrobium agile]